jgi:hypothetical protein
MVMSRDGTFDYVFVAAEESRDGSMRMQGSLRQALSPGDRRLAGHEPVLQCAEYQRESWQLYSRLTLIATDERNATVASASISVERGLVRMLRRGDIVHITRTACAAIGLSVLRDDHLVAAAGAIASVPLGSDVSARGPWDLIQQAEAIFQRRDPSYNLRDRPIEVSVAGETRILHCGRPRMGTYDVLVRHGFLWGIPGTDACASIERRGVCPDTAAHTSAQLLEEGGIDIVEAAGC